MAYAWDADFAHQRLLASSISSVFFSPQPLSPLQLRRLVDDTSLRQQRALAREQRAQCLAIIRLLRLANQRIQLGLFAFEAHTLEAIGHLARLFEQRRPLALGLQRHPRLRPLDRR